MNRRRGEMTTKTKYKKIKQKVIKIIIMEYKTKKWIRFKE